MNYEDPNDWRSGNQQNGQYQNNNYQNDWQNDPGRRPQKHNALSTAAMVLGIISAVSCSFLLYLVVPLAILGIIFAILSRGKERRMNARAKVGLVTSIAGLVLSIVFTVSTIKTIMPYVQSGDFQQYLEEYLGGIYGSDGNSSQDGSNGNGGSNGGTLDDWLEQFNGEYGGSDNGNDWYDGGNDNGNDWYDDGSGSWYGDDGGQYTPYDGGNSYHDGSSGMV